MQWSWDPEKTARWLEPAVEIPYLAERWRKLGFRRFLDSGCGPGRHAMYFADKGFLVTGLDQSRQALEYLEAWARREQRVLDIREGDLCAMPFGAEAFDCIVDYNASYHTDTAGYRQAVAELHRVLRPGGEVFLTLPSQRDAVYRQAAPEERRDRFTVVHAADGRPHFYAPREELAALFPGFSLALPIREVIAPGRDHPRESVHFHLLLKRL